jgi:hypothetical protein
MDKIVNLFKWPVVLLALWSLPAFCQSLDYFNFKNLRFVALIGGIFMFFVARTSMDKDARASLEILAHELTHSFFALLTLHKVRHIRIAADNSGGSMGFLGKGNWLITIAPYFFPLFCFIYMLIIGFYVDFSSMDWVLSAVFGFFIGYHIDTVVSQIHEKQTDLPKVGYPFCVMFLPSANFLVIGSMLAFNSNGWQSVWIYQKLIWNLNLKNLGWLLNNFL